MRAERCDRRSCEPRGLRIRIRIEARLRILFAAGPEARAADLVRIRFARDPVGQMRNAAGMRRSRTAGESRGCKIGAAPEEMHWNALADEARPELLEHALRLHQHAPVAIGVLAVVGAMNLIRVEPDRVRQLIPQRA